MRRSSTLLLAASLAAAPALAFGQAAAPTRPKPAQLPSDSMAIGRRYAQWIYTSMADSLVAHMDSAARAGDVKALKADYEEMAIQIAARAGTETKVLEEKYITRNGMRQYWRAAEFTGMSEPLLLRLVINSKGELMGRGFGPKSQAPPIDP